MAPARSGQIPRVLLLSCLSMAKWIDSTGMPGAQKGGRFEKFKIAQVGNNYLLN